MRTRSSHRLATPTRQAAETPPARKSPGSRSARQKAGKLSPVVEPTSASPARRRRAPAQTDPPTSPPAPTDLFFISTEPDGESDHDQDTPVDQVEGDAGDAGDAGDTADAGDAPAQPGPKSKATTRPPRAKKAKMAPMSEFSEKAEKHLEKFLFGALTSTAPEEADTRTTPEDTFGQVLWGEDYPADPPRRPAWADDHESALVKDVTQTYARAHGQHGQKEISTEKYASAIRKKYLSVVGTPKWADLARQRDTDGDSDDEFFRETTDMLATGRTAALARGRLEYRKMKDLNQADHSQGAVITCAEFHPQSAIGLVAGLNGTASLFHVDGKLNPKMQSVNFKDFPIQTAHFSAGGQEFIVGSPNFAHFYTYDMAKGVTSRIELPKSLGPAKIQKFEVSPNGDYLALHGKFGHLHFLHARTKTRAFSLKMNAKVRAVAFSPDGNQIYSHGDEGEVYLWDIRGRDCVHRFYDDGCIQGTAITVSPDQRYVATGSSSGVVNLYSREKLTQARPKPDKIVLNLSTSISEVKFNPTSEILALRSMMMDNALKMLHVPSMSVFENFPSLSFDFKRPNSMDFSLNGGYLSIGNNRGAANLYRLKHFQNY